MNTVDVMREYNEFERKRINSFNGVKKTDSNLTKFVSNDRHGSYISFFSFDESLTESIVKEQLAYYNKRNLCFEWKTYSTDKPSNIGEVLLANGFRRSGETIYKPHCDQCQACQALRVSVPEFKLSKSQKRLR